MNNRIEKISIDAKALIRSEKNLHLRERAITDIIKSNEFGITGHEGPFSLHFEVADNKFLIAINKNEKLIDNIAFSLTPLRRIVKDYHIICESYYDAVKNADTRKVEAIDMGRRGVHNEGSEILEELLSDKVNVDFETLRKLFSLIYVLQIK
jgi:uncharacterized protein (UPF0262 family)